MVLQAAKKLLGHESNICYIYVLVTPLNSDPSYTDVVLNIDINLQFS